MTEAERTMIQALAAVVIVDRLTNTMVDRDWIDPIGKGRTHTLRDLTTNPHTPAELKWRELQRHYDSGGYKPQEAPQ